MASFLRARCRQGRLQRHTHDFETPARRMISAVAQPLPVAKMKSAHATRVSGTVTIGRHLLQPPPILRSEPDPNAAYAFLNRDIKHSPRESYGLGIALSCPPFQVAALAAGPVVMAATGDHTESSGGSGESASRDHARVDGG
jgi:hypothetical protein